MTLLGAMLPSMQSTQQLYGARGLQVVHYLTCNWLGRNMIVLAQTICSVPIIHRLQGVAEVT